MYRFFWMLNPLREPKTDSGAGGGGDKGGKEVDPPEPKKDGEGGTKGGKEVDPPEPKEGDDDPKWDDRTKSYIKKLREENASSRKKNKELDNSNKALTERQKAILKAAGLEEEADDPEEQVKQLSLNNSQLAFKNAILESAVHHGIAGDDVEYFEFLVAKAVDGLEEGAELSEEQLAEIATKVKKAGKGKASTSTKGGNGKEGGEPPPPGASGEVSLDAFVAMTITEKSQLYEKQPEVYKKLFEEARSKKRI